MLRLRGDSEALPTSLSPDAIFLCHSCSGDLVLPPLVPFPLKPRPHRDLSGCHALAGIFCSLVAYGAKDPVPFTGLSLLGVNTVEEEKMEAEMPTPVLSELVAQFCLSLAV